jgi:hypothetical protein
VGALQDRAPACGREWAKRIAAQLGVHTVIAEVLPGDKASRIAELQGAGEEETTEGRAGTTTSTLWDKGPPFVDPNHFQQQPVLMRWYGLHRGDSRPTTLGWVVAFLQGDRSAVEGTAPTKSPTKLSRLSYLVRRMRRERQERAAQRHW